MVSKEETTEVKNVRCPLEKSCPIIKNGGVKCIDGYADCLTYRYIDSGIYRID